MAMNNWITVEIIYATLKKQELLTVKTLKGSTIENVIDRSGILMLYPEIDLLKQAVGIFSQRKQLSDLVKEGDRIEIYRLLVIDPKEARKKRSKPQK